MAFTYTCSICPRSYENAVTRRIHREDQHTFCTACNKHIGWTETQIMSHYANTHSLCYDCDSHQYYDDEEELHRHRLAYHADIYCGACRLLFDGPSQLDAVRPAPIPQNEARRTESIQHLRSSKHQAKSVPCAARRLGCFEMFVSPAAMFGHLEAGICVSGATRANVNAKIIELDRGRLIANPSRLLTNGTARWLVGPDMYDEYARRWVCYLCNKATATERQMQQHLDSPVHAQKLFRYVAKLRLTLNGADSYRRCPDRQCGKQTTTLSGIMQHIESQRCKAYAMAMGFIQQLERKMSSFMLTN